MITKEIEDKIFEEIDKFKTDENTWFSFVCGNKSILYTDSSYYINVDILLKLIRK